MTQRCGKTAHECPLAVVPRQPACAEHPSETTVATARVISITQLTHDGVSKTNLLSDDSNLYVTEWPSSGRVLAKYSLPAASRSLIPSAFANVQALDISPDHSALLVAPIRGGASNNQFWTLPVHSGTPHKLGELAGRDASWSADGQQLYLRRVRHCTSQVPAAARSVKSLKAKARFSLLEFLPTASAFASPLAILRRTPPRFGKLAAMAPSPIPCWRAGNTLPALAVATGPLMVATTFFRSQRTVQRP